MRDAENCLEPQRAASYFSLGFRDFLSDRGHERFISCGTRWGLKAWNLDFHDDKASGRGCFFHSRYELIRAEMGFLNRCSRKKKSE